jgi:hypothetical protein
MEFKPKAQNEEFPKLAEASLGLYQRKSLQSIDIFEATLKTPHEFQHFSKIFLAFQGLILAQQSVNSQEHLH